MGPCVLRGRASPGTQVPQDTTLMHLQSVHLHGHFTICKMGGSLGRVVLPFSEAGARSIKLRHFSPWKEKDYFRRQKVVGVTWGSCPHSQPRLSRTPGVSHWGQTFPCSSSLPKPTVPKGWTSLGLQPLDQGCGLQGEKEILPCWLSPSGPAMLLAKGRNRAGLCRVTQGQTPQQVALGGQGPLSPSLLALPLLTPQCLCPTSVPRAPRAGDIATGHCQGHWALHRQMGHTRLRQNLKHKEAKQM